MTISDFVARLTRLQKEIGSVAQIKLGKDYGEKSPVFDYFDIVVVGKDIILVPSDVWERKETAYRPSLNDFFQGE